MATRGRQQRSRALHLDAVFDPNDPNLRYWLERKFVNGIGTIAFLMLNGSAADAQWNDSTVSKCERCAIRLGYGRLIVVNLFAAMARHPHDLSSFADPIGPLNDAYIARALDEADLTVCAWSDHGAYLDRSRDVLTRLAASRQLHCLAVNKSGHPAHPLYLSRHLDPQIYTPPPALLPKTAL